MLRRLYIDNYKSLVNFEVALGQTHLLMGANGSGKSTVFAALAGLQRIVHDGDAVDEVFDARTLTRWQTRPVQTFELELEGPDGAYFYKLRVDHKLHQIEEEHLEFDGATIYHATAEGAEVVVAGKSARLLVDPWRSGLSVVRRRAGASRVSWFAERMGRIHVLSIQPGVMTGLSREDDDVRRPAPDFSNFAAWYLLRTQTQGPELEEARDALRTVMPGFFALRRSGVDDRLVSEWRLGEHKVQYDFLELSEGQRALIALYMLVYASGDDGVTLAIDEPDNFVALAEIQPWINVLGERSGLQTLLISHHPEVINLQAAQSGLVFRRDDGGPTRVERFVADDDETLTPAELIARGWYRGAV